MDSILRSEMNQIRTLLKKVQQKAKEATSPTKRPMDDSKDNSGEETSTSKPHKRRRISNDAKTTAPSDERKDELGKK